MRNESDSPQLPVILMSWFSSPDCSSSFPVASLVDLKLYIWSQRILQEVDRGLSKAKMDLHNVLGVCSKQNDS